MELGVPVEEPREEIQTNGKHAIFIMFFLVVAMAVFAIGAFSLNKFFGKMTDDSESELVFKHFTIAKYNDEPIFIYKSEYQGEHSTAIKDFEITIGENKDGTLSDFEKNEVMDYEAYKAYCEKWGIEQKYSSENKNYAVLAKYFPGAPNVEAKLAEVYEGVNSVGLYYYYDASGVTADITGFAIVVPVNLTVTNLNSTPLYSQESYNNLLRYGTTYDPNKFLVDKPMIYLYPEKETEITVELTNAKNLTVSYPKYQDGWKVLAKPSGDLVDLKTGRKLYGLYYETQLEHPFKVEEDGFVVAGSDAARFLEEKLAILGLDEREAEEFIVYWLPKLEKNKFNYIRFATKDEIEQNMGLSILPKPDTMIKVWMSFKGLVERIEVTEQKLKTPERKGFTVVEWGGTEL